MLDTLITFIVGAWCCAFILGMLIEKLDILFGALPIVVWSFFGPYIVIGLPISILGFLIGGKETGQLLSDLAAFFSLIYASIEGVKFISE